MARVAQRVGLWCALALSSQLVLACSDDDDQLAPAADASVKTDGAAAASDGGAQVELDASRADAGADAASGSVLKACLDQPGTLDAPPSGALTCELLPPGLTL